MHSTGYAWNCRREEETAWMSRFRTVRQGNWGKKQVISLNTTVAFCNEQIDIFVATDLVKTQQHLDDGEYVEVFEYGIEELVDMVYQGKIMDAKTISGIMTYYEKYVRGRKVK